MPVDPLAALQDALMDRYRIERLLGRGGMARVYLAQDLKHDRQVAVKVLRPELTVTLGRERFLREIQIAARLNHPHILALHDSGDANGLLYYVMPYVEGESVFQLLERQGPQPIEEALRIAREVATALSYAHARGVLHRDIKPGNILLSDGHAVVADFGLARAVTEAQTDRSITGEGLTIGTPAYMSPEQGMGEEGLDARSDVYSLGCVLYELLAGNPPYVASNPHAILGKHAHDPVPSIRTVRPEVPEWLDRVLQRALAKEPADRFGSAEELAEALQAPEVAAPPDRWYLRAATLAAVLLATAVGTWAFGVQRGWWGRGAGTGPVAADTSLIAVLPPTGLPEGDIATRDIAQLLQDALTRWEDVKVVDRFQVDDAIAQRGNSTLTATEAAGLSRGLGAGRYIRSELIRTGDSLQLRAGLFELGRRAALQEVRDGLRGDLRGADSTLAHLVDRLLLRGLAAGAPASAVRGTRSLRAFQAYRHGLDRIQDWNLEAADSALDESLRYDGDNPLAALWLAQVRLWNNAPAPRWRPFAEQAAAGRERLGGIERLLADGALGLAHDDYSAACAAYRSATRRDPNRFVAWYGLATCIRRDLIVVPDRRTASGWRFRSSYEEAVKAFERAFAILPSMHVAFRSDGFQRIRDFLFTSKNSVMSGRSLAPDTLDFAAYPGWEGDTLVFVPYLREEIIKGKPEARKHWQEATIHQRRRFHDIALRWTTAFPHGADALEALALSLELLGDPSALDTLRRARAAAQQRREALRVAASEVWLRLKLALPDDRPGLELVRALADSILASSGYPDAPDPAVLARLAALRGRGFQAAELGASAAARGSLRVPASLVRDGPAFWTFAALGGPRDSLMGLEKRVEAAIEALMVPGGEQAGARSDWLSRPVSLAYPEVRLSWLERLPAGGESLAHAQAAAMRDDWTEVRRILGGIRNRRLGLMPEDITLDRLYPEAHLFTLLGEPRAAAEWLDPTLAALRRLPPHALIDVPNVGALVRTMAFRADLARTQGDPVMARRWAGAVAILWSGADPFLDPLVRRMRRMAE